MSNAPNPKQAFGDKKPPIGQLPLIPMLEWASAQFDGALKYGPFNWRERPVEALTYGNAAERHLKLWLAGERLTRDTRIANLGAVMACCSILIDAEAHGTLIDNRFKSQVEADALHEAEEWVARLKAMHAERLAAAQESPPKSP